MMMGRRDFGSVRKLPSGRWQATYHHNGERHTGATTFSAKSDAAAWLASVETDIGRGGWVDPRAGRITLAAMLERWLESNGSKRASSRARDRAIIENHLPPALAARVVATISRSDIQALVDSWAGKPSTVNRQYSTLRAAFAWAEASDVIARTPCRSIRLPKVELVERPTLSAQQLQRLADALGPDQAPFMWLGAVGGLRWAETAGLTVGAIALPAGVVKVSAQLGRDGRLGPPKSAAGRRSLAVPVWLAEDLAAAIARRGLTGADADALVFVDRAGGPLDYTNWRRRTWARATKAAGLPALRFHDLRSMAATALVASGTDIKTAMTRMGHSSPQVTLGIYARATAEADRLAADKIGEILGPSRTRRAGPGS
jgi:integrase